MHLNPLLLASLSLLAPGFSAPTSHSPNIEISITTEASFPGSASEVSRSEDLCLRRLFPPGFDCTQFGPEWYFKANTCCRKVGDDSPSSAAVVPAPKVSINEDICLPTTFPPGFNCNAFGRDWYYKGRTCCLFDGIGKKQTSSTIDFPAPEVSRDQERCLKAYFPPEVDCTRFGPEWYYNKEIHVCCKRVDYIPQEASTVAVPAHADSLTEVCAPDQFPQGFRCRIAFGSGWSYNKERATCCTNVNLLMTESMAVNIAAQEASLYPEICAPLWIPPHADCEKLFAPGWHYKKETGACCKSVDTKGDFSVELQVNLQNDMPTGFESKSSVHSNVDAQEEMPTGFESKPSVQSNANVHGGMLTGFESKSRVESYENVHTEML